MNLDFDELLKKLASLLHTSVLADAKDVVALLTTLMLAGVGKRYLTKLKETVLNSKLETNTKFISDQLAILCGTVNADRTVFYVFKGEVALTNKELKSFCTHDAVKAGISSYLDKKSDKLVSDYAPFLELLLVESFLSYTDVNQEIANIPLRQTLTGMGVVSVSTHIVKNAKGLVVGYINAEYVNRQKDLSTEDLKKALSKFATVIGSAINKTL